MLHITISNLITEDFLGNFDSCFSQFIFPLIYKRVKQKFGQYWPGRYLLPVIEKATVNQLLFAVTLFRDLPDEEALTKISRTRSAKKSQFTV